VRNWQGARVEAIPLAIPETPLCARSKIAFFCYDHERLSICFDESLSYRFHRKTWLLPWPW